MRDSNTIPIVRLAHQNRFIKRNKYQTIHQNLKSNRKYIKYKDQESTQIYIVLHEKTVNLQIIVFNCSKSSKLVLKKDT
jgi:hypothetical protein